MEVTINLVIVSQRVTNSVKVRRNSGYLPVAAASRLGGFLATTSVFRSRDTEFAICGATKDE